MAQAAVQARPRPPRGSLSRAQRSKIRDWRSDLGHAIWDLNESPLVHELRRQYETSKPWDPDDMIAFAGGVEKVVLIALEIRKELSAFIKKGGRMRKDAKEMPKQYLDRLKGALEGTWLGVGYLRNLMPDRLEDFIGDHMGENWEPGMAEMLFFGFCPIGAVATREMPSGAREAVLEDHVEQLYARERVAKMLDLKGMEKETQQVRRKLQSQLKRGQEKEVHEKGGCYFSGMKALRASVTQMFYTLQAHDVRRIKLNNDDSDYWHSWSQESGEPPEGLVSQMQGVADDEGRVLHVFDKDDNLVYVAMPVWYSGEDPDSLAERAALKQSKRARSSWNYDWKAATPADSKEFHATLNATQRRRVSEFLKRHEHRSFTIEEIAELAGVPVHVPADTKRFQAASAAHFAKNPDDVVGITDAVDETARNHGLMTALWRMDLD